MTYPVFSFEREDDPDGRWIPMAVRMKLDLAGIKIGLDHWQALPEAARDDAFTAPVETDGQVVRFRESLLRAIDSTACAGDVETLDDARRSSFAAWRDAAAAPTEKVAAALESAGYGGCWPRLDLFGRYTVCALVRKKKSDRLRVALNELLGGEG